MPLPMTGMTYRYPELCSLMGETTRSGNSKRSQLRRWHSMFEWENPTTQRYLITSVFESPRHVYDGRSGNGGARTGAGAKQRASEEFDYLANAFLHREFNRNSHNGSSNLCQSYFSGSDIGKYFGLHADDFYSAEIRDEDRARWSEIARKVSDRRRRWIYDRMSKMDGVSVQDGIVAYIDKPRMAFEYRDDYLEEWNEHMDSYLRSVGASNAADIVDMGLWPDMICSISDKFDGYDTVERTKKVTFDASALRDYDWSEYERMRAGFNKEVVRSVSRCFKGREDEEDCTRLIDRYVMI